MLSDVKYTLRSLLKTPGFTVIAVFTFALGIGATTAIFSVVNTVLLKPLAYAEPERLARIYTQFPNMSKSSLDGSRATANVPEYLDLLRESTAWESIEGWVDFAGVNLASTVEPTRVAASFVTGGFLSTLGIQPALGRLITSQDDKPGAPKVVVISHGVWQRNFGGDRKVLGQEILLNEVKHIVIGIMPQGFRSPLGMGAVDASEVWTPLQIDPANPGPRNSHDLNLFGRLRPNVTLHQAQAELDSLVRHWGEGGGSGDFLNPQTHPLVAYGMHDEVVRGARPALHMLLGAVCFLLLIACVNVANLLLTRAEARKREIAVRGALGAGLWRLARQFAVEGIVISLLSAGIGLLLAHLGLQLIQLAGETSIPRAAEISIDGRVLFFAVAVSVLTGLIFSLAPLFHIAKANLHGTMKSAAASTTEAAGAKRFRQTLVVSQLALALVLLAGTGLMMRAFWKLQQVNVGFDPRSVMTMSIGLPSAAGSSADFVTRLEGRINTLPGVQSVAFATALPPAVSPNFRVVGTKIEGYVPTPGGPREIPDYPGRFFIDSYRSVTQGYVNALRIPVLEGRFFDQRDTAQAPKVAVLNRTTARMFWGGKSPIGRRIEGFGGERTIIGVIADVKNDGLENPVATEVYLPYTQAPIGEYVGFLNLLIRLQGDPSAVVAGVRRELKQIDPRLPLTKVRAMEELVSAAQSRSRFLTLLLTAFASVALLLAAVGIYGVISYSVAQRTKEIGIRMALGAQHGAVMNLVLGRGLLLTVCGIAIGLAGAFALTRFLSGFLFNVTATDPATFLSVSLLLGAIALLASYLPARRATRVDPLIALRAE